MNNTNDISFGGIESPPDYRNLQFIASANGVPDIVPDNYEPIFVNILPVWNQKKIGACVAYAWGKSRQKTELQETSKVISFSPRFLYALAKSMDNIPTEGTYPRLIAKILQNYGCALEDTIPNDSTLSYSDYIDLTKISQAAYIEAKPYSIGGYSFVSIDSEEIKKAIYYSGEQRKDLVMLVNLGKEWWTDKKGNSSWNPDDILPLRPPISIISGHEIYPYKYETEKGRLKIWFFNSWSDRWGIEGKGYFYYDEYYPYIKEIITAIDLPDNWMSQIKILPSQETFSHNFLSDIVLRQSGNEVIALQTALMIDGEFSKDLYMSLLRQNQLGFYGTISKNAVFNFMLKYNVGSFFEKYVYPAGKRVGPKTRSMLNRLFNK